VQKDIRADRSPSLSIDEVLAAGAVRSVFQPIVDLDTGRVVAYEALARGPEGPLARPDALFAAARAEGRLAELDAACRVAAFAGAVEHGLLAPLTLFVNVEPEVLDRAPLDDLLAIAQDAPGELRVVLEITERALAVRPADLLRTVERVRDLGWGLALDDVGADVMSLAFMPLLRPDVVKLDLRLVQDRPGPQIAEIMNAVNAYSERSGALILAEGIETEEHLLTARALGARLGQGWLLGRPAAGPAADHEPGSWSCRLRRPPTPTARRSPACRPGRPCGARRRTCSSSSASSSSARPCGSDGPAWWRRRSRRPGTSPSRRPSATATWPSGPGSSAPSRDGLSVEPAPGVRGRPSVTDRSGPREWDVVVIGPHFAAALLARDLGDTGPDLQRTFEYALTYDRDTVSKAATALLTRVAPRLPAVTRRSAPSGRRWPRPCADRRSCRRPTSAGETLLHRALAATTSGVTIADMTRPDSPLMYVNSAFETLTGLPREQLLGRNCRFLQGSDTDAAAVSRIRAAVVAGQECRETLLNYRGRTARPGGTSSSSHPSPTRTAGWCSTSASRTTSRPASRASARSCANATGRRATWRGSSSWPTPTR
jgi:EAL domain-containing protein (putative c-di-GMP-specific phosphodiesterase class I)